MEILKYLPAQPALVICLDNIDYYADPLLKVGQAVVMDDSIMADLPVREQDAQQRYFSECCAIIIESALTQESIYDIEVYTIEEDMPRPMEGIGIYETVTTVVVCHKDDVHKLYEIESGEITHILFDNVLATSQLTSQTRLVFPTYLQISKIEWH